jgi:4-hydroxy-tetrahydrodipicolinate synthase
MKTIDFSGCWTALITPMNEDGSLDYEGWRRLLRIQIEAKINGLVPIGTTGENPTLDEAEEDKLIAIAVEESAAKNGQAQIPVMVGTGSNDTKHAVAYTKRAKDMGADACLVVTPYYNKPNDEGLYAHYSKVAEVGLPVILYNVPGRTSRLMSPALVERLSTIPGVVGVKEASGDISVITDIIQRCVIERDSSLHPFQVLSGDDALTLPVIALGGRGVVSVVSNLIPDKMVALTSACLKGDWKEGRRRFYELLPFFRSAFLEANPIPIKRAMTLAGLPAGPCRLPLGPLSEANEAIIRAELTRLRI